MNNHLRHALVLSIAIGTCSCTAQSREQPPNARSAPLAQVDVEAQPLAANVQRVVTTLEYLGAPLPADLRDQLTSAGQARDGRKLQELIDAHALLAVHINPEVRVKVARGPAPAVLQQAGYTPVLVKIINESRSTPRLRIGSPQSGPVYAGMSKLSGERMQQQHLRENENVDRRTDRFLDLEMFTAAPMTPNLSGLEVEYAVALIYSSEAGRREATITFNAGQGTEDLGFRAEVPVLFTIKPAIPVKLSIQDHDGTPTVARLQFVDRQGHVFPPQAKRLAPDLFFQKHIYRANGETVLLPPGALTMFYGRGPEYRWSQRTVTIAAPDPKRDGNGSAMAAELAIKLERWIDPAAYGFFSGDHHIHAAGCAHYTSPSEGVDPVRHVPAGEGRGAERRQRAHVGSRVRPPAAVFCAGGGHAQRAAHGDQVRHRSQRIRFRSARPRRLAQFEGADLSGRERQPRLADLDATRAALDEGAGRSGRVRALGQRIAGRCRGRDRAAARTVRYEQGWPACCRGDDG